MAGDSFDNLRQRNRERLRAAEVTMNENLAKYDLGAATMLENLSPGAVFLQCLRCGVTVVILEDGAPAQRHYETHHPIQTVKERVLRRLLAWQEARK